jgi:hypothetical protein
MKEQSVTRPCKYKIKKTFTQRDDIIEETYQERGDLEPKGKKRKKGRGGDARRKAKIRKKRGLKGHKDVKKRKKKKEKVRKR